MNILKLSLKLSLVLLLIFGFSGCNENDNLKEKNLFTDDDFNNSDLSSELDFSDDLDSNDIFDGAEFESSDSDLGANVLDGISMGGNFFKKTEGIDLYKITGSVDFGEGTISGGVLDGIKLNPQISDKILGLKIAFANLDSNLIFDSVSYGGYGMEDLNIDNGITKFNIYFDSDSNVNRTYKIKSLFTQNKNFYTQVKFAQNKKIGNSYFPKKIVTNVFSQAAVNENGGLLFDWNCLASDFTYIKEDFKNKNEFFLNLYYEKTSTGFSLDKNLLVDDFSTSSQVLSSEFLKSYINSLFSNSYSKANEGLCALNDTYGFVKKDVVGSQCWGGELKNDVGMIVFRPHKNSFCNQAASIKLEKNYPKYACNIDSSKIGNDEDGQKYFGDEDGYVSLNGVNYTCGK